MPDPTPLEAARQRAVDVFRDPDSDETDVTEALAALENEAVAPVRGLALAALLRDAALMVSPTAILDRIADPWLEPSEGSD